MASGISYLPPWFNSAIFNSSAFNTGNYITKAEGDRLYLQIAAGRNLPLIDGITPGIAQASKALIFDASINITNINSLTSSNLIGIQSDAGTANILYPLVVSHQTSNFASILPTNSFGAGVLFQMPNNSGSLINYAAITSTVMSTLGQGQLSLWHSFGGSLVEAVNIKSLTSSTNNLLKLNGATSVIQTYQFDGSKLTLDTDLKITSNIGDALVIQSTTSSARSTLKFITDTNSYEIGSRGSTASNANAFYIYNGSYKLLMNPAGETQLLNSTNSISVSTGALTIAGGLGIAKDIYSSGKITCTDWLTVRRNGSNINLENPTSGNTSLIEHPASPNMLRLVRGFALNICTGGVTIESGSIRDARSVIDMGQTASNKQLGLYNDTVSYYGISANNSATQYSSGGSHVFYSSCSNASPINTQVLFVSSGGRVELVNNGYIGNGVYNNMIYLSSQGVVLINSGTVQSNTNWLECNGNAYFSSKIGVGITVPSYPIQVNASATTSISSYGYLSSGGAGTSGSSGSIQVAIRCADRVIASEFDAYSDLRKKQNIRPISDEEAYAFIKVTPVHYQMKEGKNLEYGYIAQDVLRQERHLLEDVISVVEEIGMEEIVDSDGFVSPKDASFAINYSKTIPLLHKYILLQEARIKKNEEDIARILSLVDRRDAKGRFAKRT